MKIIHATRSLASLSAAAAIILVCSASRESLIANPGITLSVLGTYASGFFNQGAAEISAFDPKSKRLFIVNGATSSIDVLDLSNPAGNLGPEGLVFVPGSDSPNKKPLLIVTNEVSGTTTIFQIERVD